MKTSKIIFIGMLSTIALLMMVGAIDLRITGQKGNNFQVDFKVIRKKIPSFKVLCINDNGSIELVKGDSSFIDIVMKDLKVPDKKDSMAPDLKYTLTGDTLKLSDRMMSGGRSFRIKIHTTDLLKQILAKNSTVNLTNFCYSNLSLDLDHSRLNINQIKDEKQTFQLLNIAAKNNSNITTSNTGIDTLKIDLQKSNAIIMSNLNTICGNLTDHSKIVLRQVNQISLKKDASSKIQIYN
jgi:hypothetical protein